MIFMSFQPKSILNPKKRYLQIALNSTLEEARAIINVLPINDRIIVEAGTPLIKRYGEYGIRQIRSAYEQHIYGVPIARSNISPTIDFLLAAFMKEERGEEGGSAKNINAGFTPYIVADLKTMDRGETEVAMAARAGASAAVALGSAPIETLNAFVDACENYGLDAMIDMMNVEFPLTVLRALKKVPPVIILHRGVDEEQFNRQKMIPLHEIRRIKGNYNILIAIAGGDTLREVQSSIFNDADIVVVWKSVYEKTTGTLDLVNGFIKAIK
jgi:bifunctional enzyme Fae/Hps